MLAGRTLNLFDLFEHWTRNGIAGNANLIIVSNCEPKLQKILLLSLRDYKTIISDKSNSKGGVVIATTLHEILCIVNQLCP